MRRVTRLKREAQEGCAWRGHTMTKFHRHGKYPRTAHEATCTKCHMYVQVLDNPWPNEISIGGNAVALTCPEQEATQ